MLKIFYENSFTLVNLIFLKLYRWCAEAGGNISIDVMDGKKQLATPVDDSNPFWVAFKNATIES